MAPGYSTSPPPNSSAIHLPPTKRPKLATNPLSSPAMSQPPYSPSPMQFSQGPPQPVHQVTMLPQQQPTSPYPQPQQQQQQQPQQQQPQTPQIPQLQQPQIPQHLPTPPPQNHHHSSMNSMPPPTAPASLKPTDPNELADALTSAGIDLKEEEAKLASFSAGGGILSGFHHDMYNGNNPEADQYAQAVRRQVEIKTNHMRDPFLNPQVLSNRLLMKTRSENLQPFHLRDSNGNVSLNGQNADLAVLLSLAIRERLNHLITRGAALAKARRRPQGQIVGEWANYVSGVTPEMKPESAISPGTNTLKRSFSSANDIPGGLVPVATIPNETAKALRALKQREWEVDQERLRKKARRLEAQSAAGGSAPPTPGSAACEPPGTPGAEAADKRMTAKETRKHQANKIEEQLNHRAANATANMMMGNFGVGNKKKKKTYAWMMPGGGGGGGGGGATSAMGGLRPGVSGIGTVSGGDAGIAQANAAPDISNLQWMGQRIGVWREEGDRGKNIQIRDWVGALEGDGRVGGKGIIKAYLRMK